MEDRANLFGDLFIYFKPWTNKYHCRTKLDCFPGRHSRSDPEFSRLITGGSHDTSPTLWRTANSDGFSTIFRMIALFDGCVKCIHVDMNDFSEIHRDN